MTRTFLDASVLIAAARGTRETSSVAMAIIEDFSRDLVSSVFVRLEVVPTAHFRGEQDELAFYDELFGGVEIAEGSPALIAQAFA